MNITRKKKILKNKGLIEDLINFLIDESNVDFDFNSLHFIFDNENAENALGKTGFYNIYDKEISIYCTKRHIKDILRSISHEFCHHIQNDENKFSDYLNENLKRDNNKIILENGRIISKRKLLSEKKNDKPYFLHDDYLNEIEREAYEQGNMYFRHWEEIYKQK